MLKDVNLPTQTLPTIQQESVTQNPQSTANNRRWEYLPTKRTAKIVCGYFGGVVALGFMITSGVFLSQCPNSYSDPSTCYTKNILGKVFLGTGLVSGVTSIALLCMYDRPY